MIGQPDDNERLVLLLSKELFRRGDEAVREGSRFSHGIAVSHFHDAAEICARAAALKVGAPVKPDANFLEYWTKTNEWAERQQLEVRLGRHAEMGDLNEARKYFKHRGKLMQPEYVVGYRATTHAFLVDVFRDFFSSEFDSISSVTFLRELRVKTQLEAAQNALATGDVMLALERCADAWAVTSRQQRAFQYAHQSRAESVSPELVRHVIKLIADYSAALLRQIDGFTRPAWSDGIVETLDDTDGRAPP